MIMNLLDDNELLIQLQQESPAAFEKLYHRYHRLVFTFSFNLLASRRDAEETVQYVFEALWNQRKSLKIDSSLHAYLFGIARNKVYSLIRHKIRHEAFTKYYLELNHEYDFVTEEAVAYHELKEKLDALLLELPKRRREIFNLSRFNGLSFREISQKLGISENTVDTQIRHALNYLRGKLSDDFFS
jgi:RNA polymerase sigma-70 factor (ECF subfamily)